MGSRRHRGTIVVGLKGTLAEDLSRYGQSAPGRAIPGSIDFLKALQTRATAVCLVSDDPEAAREWMECYSVPRGIALATTWPTDTVAILDARAIPCTPLNGVREALEYHLTTMALDALFRRTKDHG